MNIYQRPVYVHCLSDTGIMCYQVRDSRFCTPVLCTRTVHLYCTLVTGDDGQQRRELEDGEAPGGGSGVGKPIRAQY